MSGENTQPKYQDHAPGAIVTAAMTLLKLSSTGMQQLLGNRTSDSLIRLWRTNRRRPPQWATEIIANEIERDTAARAELAQQVRSIAGPGRGSTALTAWRLHRLAQKEKAGD